MKHRSFNILGSVALVNFSREDKLSDKKKFAREILKKNKVVKTVLEKSENFSGRLRKMKTRHLAGKKNKEVLYKENNCVFRFNIDSCYFSPRLSNERKEIAKRVKKGDKVLVMFAGVAPFSIVIAKNSSAKKIYSNEINREANKYAKLNLELNKVKDKVVLIDGDIKKVVEKWARRNAVSVGLHKKMPPPCISRKERGYRVARKIVKSITPTRWPSWEENKGLPRFDVIVMPRPNLKESFLEQAFMLSKKGTRIIYYDFCKVEDKEKVVEKIKKEASRAKKKIKILKVKDAGEIAPYKVRVRVEFEVQ